MTWTIKWSYPAITALRAIPWRQAARIDAAVQRFVASGEGDRFRLASDDLLTVRLRVPPHIVRIGLESKAQIARVWYVYRP
jgi:hypothetical protein